MNNLQIITESDLIRLLVSDIDGTLLGDDDALNRFADWINGQRGKTKLVYASGRFYESVCESIETTSLPTPDAIIGGVGSSIRFLGEKVDSPAWNEAISEHWNADAVTKTLADFPRLERQPDEFQSARKVSFYLQNATEDELNNMIAKLDAAGLSAKIIYSSARDLDVLPSKSDKGSAAAFLARHWNIAPENVVTAGDSGNDQSLFDKGFRGIIVANAQPELRDFQHPTVYHATQPFAAGVLEGIDYWQTQATEKHESAKAVRKS